MIDHKTNTTSLVPDPPRAVPGRFFLRRMRALVFCGVLFTGLGVVLGVGLPALFYLLGGRISPVVDWDLHYTFTEHRGLEVKGKDRTYHYVWAGELKPGDKVGVVYNPRSPEANVLWLHGDDVPSEA